VEPLKWFKLLLAKVEDLPRHMTQDGDFDKIEEARFRLNEMGKTVEDVVADYLRFLWTHVLAAIERAKTKPVLNTTTFHVVLTFPAIWKADAMQKMRDAAQKAGILDRRRAGPTVLDLVPEPEAAALATYADIINEIEHARDASYVEGQFQPGETFVVLDAGGGTCVSVC
jgi:molecular chaperone DnaK (HSP70)